MAVSPSFWVLERDSLREVAEKLPEPNQKYLPYSFSALDQQFFYHDSEYLVIDKLRSWIKDHFSQALYYEPNLYIPCYAKHNRDGERYFKDFDINARVVYSQFENVPCLVRDASLLPSQSQPSKAVLITILQDINGLRYTFNIPVSRFEDYKFNGFAPPFSGSFEDHTRSVALSTLRVGNVLRVKNAKLCQVKNHYKDEEQKLYPSLCQVGGIEDEFFFIDFEFTKSSLSHIIVIPDFFISSQIIRQRVVPQCVLRVLSPRSALLKEPLVVSKTSK